MDIDKIFASLRDQIVEKGDGALHAITMRHNPDGFSVLPPPPDVPGFRVCGILDEAGMDAVCEALAKRKDIALIRARLMEESGEIFISAAKDYHADPDNDVPSEIREKAENAPDDAPALMLIAEDLPGPVYDDFRDYCDRRIAEEGVFCLDVSLREGVLKGKISFAPYYDFNYPLFEKTVDGDPARFCAKELKKEFPGYEISAPKERGGPKA